MFRSSKVAPEATGSWVETFDDESGAIMYINVDTNETAWELPEGAQLAADGEPPMKKKGKKRKKGKKKKYNKETGDGFFDELTGALAVASREAQAASFAYNMPRQVRKDHFPHADCARDTVQ